MFVRAYLRASTSEQDASRARADLEAFATGHGMRIAAWYMENESGATLARPELFRLLADASEGDVLLIEQVDRLSRLNATDWQRLRQEIDRRGIKIVALDLPTSWHMASADAFTGRMLSAINGMLLDMLAAVARKDYEDRRRRQSQGIEKAKASGVYRGRPENRERNAAIAQMLSAGMSYSAIEDALRGKDGKTVSRATIAKVASRANA